MQTQAINGELKNLKRDLGALTDQVEKAIHVQSKQAKTALKDFGQDSSEEIRTMLEQINGQLQTLKSTLQAKTKQVEKTVEDHPWAALLGALGVGLALGKLLDSRRTQ